MNGRIVKQKIDANNYKIESLLDVSKFILNKKIHELMEENEQLQNQCEHVAEHGVCIYCGKEVSPE